MGKMLLILLVAGTLTTAVMGLAASLGALTAADLFSATQDVSSCDPVVTVLTTDDGTNITEVTVSDIADACQLAGATLLVLIEAGGTTIAARSGVITNSSGDIGDDKLTLVPDTNGDALGETLVPVAGSTTTVLITNGTVSIDPGTLAVTITP